MFGYDILGFGARASTAFLLPSDLDGLVRWLRPGIGWFQDAAGTMPALAGDVVGLWQDQSGSGDDCSTVTTPDKPIRTASVLNGFDGLRFNDAAPSGNRLLGTNALTAPFTIFIVYNYRSTTSIGRRALHGQGSNWLMGPYQNVHKTYSGNFTTGQTVVENQFVIHEVTQTSLILRNFVDGTTYGTHSSPGAPGIIDLGQRADPLDGDIVEVIFYDSELSSADRLSVRTYLNDIYLIF